MSFIIAFSGDAMEFTGYQSIVLVNLADFMQLNLKTSANSGFHDHFEGSSEKMSKRYF